MAAEVALATSADGATFGTLTGGTLTDGTLTDGTLTGGLISIRGTSLMVRRNFQRKRIEAT